MSTTLPAHTRRREPAMAAGTPASAAAAPPPSTGPRLPAVASSVAGHITPAPAMPSSSHGHSSFAPSSTARSRLKTPFSQVHVVDMAATASPSLSLEHALLLDRPQPPPDTATSRRPTAAQASTTSASRLSRLYPQQTSSDGVYGSGTHDLSLYRSTVPFTPRPLPSHMVQSSPVVDYWLHQLAWEQRQDYTNDLAVWESQLSEMLQHSGFDDLTPQRVALVCDLIDQISAHVGRWAPILRRIVRELFASVYQGYEIHDLETTVPIWQRDGASWIGWQQPSYGNALDAAEMEAILHAPTFHPLSPLSDPHMYTGGKPTMNSLLPVHSSGAPPPQPKEVEPPRTKQYFRHHLWDLNQATWRDVMEKYETAQEELIAHRIKVAKDLGMTLTSDGMRIVVGGKEEKDAQSQQQQTQQANSEQHDTIAPLPSSSQLHTIPLLTLSSDSATITTMPAGESTSIGSTTSATTHSTSFAAHPPLPRARTTSVIVTSASGSASHPPPPRTARLASFSAGMGGTAGSNSAGLNVPPSPKIGSAASPRSSGALHLPPPSPILGSFSIPPLSPLLGSASLIAGSPRHGPEGLERKGSIRENQRQSIIMNAKQAVLLASTTAAATASSPSHGALSAPPSDTLAVLPSPRFRPLTSQSMSALQSSSVGALVEQAMELSRAEQAQANRAFERGTVVTKRRKGGFRTTGELEQEEKEEGGTGEEGEAAEGEARDIVKLGEEEKESSSSSSPQRPSTTSQSSRPLTSPTSQPSLSHTEAVTAAAFQAIHSLISTPPIPDSSVIAYFDVEKRLNMQYENLYRRIRNWAAKQSELQKASSTRDLTLNRICRKLKRTLFWTMFTRWRAVVYERKRQSRVFTNLFRRYHQSPSHMHRVFLGWRIHALMRKTQALDRSVSETATKNLVLQSELTEQRFILSKEQDKRHALKVKEIDLTKERDEIKDFLEQCQAQIVSVQGAQVTHFITATIGMIQDAIGQLWKELKEAREANLQDPCRMLVSSTILTEHVNKPYTHMAEGSPEWITARRDEVKKTRIRLRHMLDSDLLLLWMNYHLAQAHLKVNQEKLQAKFYGKTYKYDLPSHSNPYPQYVRNFYSNDLSLVRRAENFTSSLQDCEVFLRLLSQISPTLCDVDILGHVDLEVRGKKLLKLLDALNHDIASTITSMDLTHSFSPDLMAALIARLMMSHTSLPVDTSIFSSSRKKPRSEYAPPEGRVLSQHEQRKKEEAEQMTRDLGLSEGAAAKAQDIMREQDRADALVQETQAELQAASMFQDAEAEILHAVRSRRNSRSSAAGGGFQTSASGYGHQPTLQEMEEEEARRAVKDCGPFTEILRALHLVNRELTTRARVEVNLVTHISGSVKKILHDARVLLDDAYERHALWQEVRRRVSAFVSIVMTHQMRGEPLIMQDRKSIRQIRRYTKLLDRSGKPQQRFSDLLHPLNRTSNDHMLIRKGQIDEESDSDGGADEEDADAASEQESVDGSAAGRKGKKKAATAAGKKPKKAKSTAGGDSDNDSASGSSSSEDDDDSSDDEADGTRTAEGDDVWRAYTPLTAKVLASMSKEEAEKETRRMRHRNETPEDLLTQMTFELTKMQENIAKHYTSLRDIFRAYAQMDQTQENAFKQREEERTQSTSTSISGKSSDLNSSSSSAGASGGGITMSKSQLKSQREKEDREDPTASVRRKLREQAASHAASTSGSAFSAAAHAEANPQFSIAEFWLMVRDTKLLNKHFTVKKCERIFEFVWQRDLKAALTASGHIDASHPFETLVKDRTKMEVDSRQFVEILIRIAHQRMLTQKERDELLAELEIDREQENERKRSEGIDVATGEISDVARQRDALTRASISIGSITTHQHPTTAGLNGASMSSNSAFEWGTPLFPSTRPGWALRLFWLIRCKLIPSAARLNVDLFRSQYKRMEVSVLFKKHGSVLRRLFYRYAKLHSVRARVSQNALEKQQQDDSEESGSAAADAVWTNTIDYREFISLLRDSKILDGRFLTLQQVYAIFSNVQADLAKVTPLAQERDAKMEKDGGVKPTAPFNKRASLTRPGAGLTVGSGSGSGAGEKHKIIIVSSPGGGSGGDGVKSGTASGSTSVAASRRGSLKTSTDWGAAAGTGPAQTLADLNLEHQAAATAVVPTDEQILAASATSNTELIFAEFLEALAAIGSVRHPNPYKPLHVRVQQFLERDLLPWTSLIFQTKVQDERS